MSNEILVRVRKVEQVPYSGFVYNVSTANHTILESNLLTHNTSVECEEFANEPEFKRLANSREDSAHVCSKHPNAPCKCDPVKCEECAPHFNADIVN